MTRRSRIILSLCFLLVVPLVSLRPCLDNGFVDNWDDDIYVVSNTNVHSPTLLAVARVFTSAYDGLLYLPVTALSLMSDHHWSRHDPFGYHLTNLFFHMSNVFLVFSFFLLLGQDMSVALGAALLFAIHPLRVESVAWVTERKDVLSGFFFLAGLNTYLWSRRRPGVRFFRFATFFLYVLAVLSKPNTLVFPGVLVLIDRFLDRRWTLSSWREKAPLLIAAVAGGCLTLGLFSSYDDYWRLIRDDLPAGVAGWVYRFGTVGYCIVNYFGKVLWPVNLSCLYACPSLTLVSASGYAVGAFVLLPLAVLWLARRTNPDKVLFGVLFFAVTLLPFLIHAFKTSVLFVMADRYTYLPALGLFYLAAEAFRVAGRGGALRRGVVWGAVLLLVIVLGAGSRQRCRVWHDSMTLWNDAIQKDPARCYAGYHNRAVAWQKQGRLDEALKDLDRASAIAPRFFELQVFRGAIYCDMGLYEEALREQDRALVLCPNYPRAIFEKGRVYALSGRTREALDLCDMVLAFKPRRPFSYLQLGRIYERLGKFDDAARMFLKAIEVDPLFFPAYQSLYSFYDRHGMPEKKEDLKRRAVLQKVEGGADV